MKFIETLKNIYKIEELRNKIGYTLLLIMVYRFASYIVLPGVNPLELDSLTSSSGGGIVDFKRLEIVAGEVGDRGKYFEVVVRSNSRIFICFFGPFGGVGSG